MEKLVPLEVADIYQPLFNHMANKHNVILTISEMDDIILKCKEFEKEFDKTMKELWRKTP